MPACRIEARRLALARSVDVKGVLSRGHVFERKPKEYSGGGLDERNGPTSWPFGSLSMALADLAASTATVVGNQDGKCRYNRSTIEKLHACLPLGCS